jgi:hypothetical protein
MEAELDQALKKNWELEAAMASLEALKCASMQSLQEVRKCFRNLYVFHCVVISFTVRS